MSDNVKKDKSAIINSDKDIKNNEEEETLINEKESELIKNKTKLEKWKEYKKQYDLKKKEKLIKCKKENCSFKKSDDSDYCGKHKTICELLDNLEEGKILCSNYKRGCRVLLDKNNPLIIKGKIITTCESCRKIKYDQEKKRDEIKKNNDIPEGHKKCSTCNKNFPSENFIGNLGKERKTCNECAERAKRADEKRKCRKRDYKKELENNPITKEKKDKWKKENIEKIRIYYMNYRKKLIENIGIDEYRKNNAENAKKWRNNNPELVEINKKKNYLNIKLGIYKRSAEKRNINWNISDEKVLELFNNDCIYCCERDENNYCGIDRVNNNNDYDENNVVSCCKLCNLIKGCLDYDIFIQNIANILINKNIIDGEKDYEYNYDNKKKITYNEYKKSSEKRNIKFELTNDEFINLKNRDCYLCGKTNTDIHSNGIDRINSNDSYNIDNCQTCCGTCNFMKNKINYDIFIDKITKIFNNRHNYTINEIFDNNNLNENKNINHIIQRLNKDDKETIKNNIKERINKKREETHQKLIDSEYINNHAKEIGKKNNLI
jgi:hypothetical protein